MRCTITWGGVSAEISDNPDANFPDIERWEIRSRERLLQSMCKPQSRKIARDESHDTLSEYDLAARLSAASVSHSGG
jgi:hypothetical protein